MLGNIVDILLQKSEDKKDVECEKKGQTEGSGEGDSGKQEEEKAEKDKTKKKTKQSKQRKTTKHSSKAMKTSKRGEHNKHSLTLRPASENPLLHTVTVKIIILQICIINI